MSFTKTYIATVTIETTGDDVQLRSDSALEKEVILGFSVRKSGTAENGLSIIGQTRFESGFLELVKGQNTVLKMPLQNLNFDTKNALYLPFRLPANSFSTERSKITFGKKTTASQREAVEIVFYLA